jgi:hypothetical protein
MKEEKNENKRYQEKGSRIKRIILTFGGLPPMLYAIKRNSILGQRYKP